MKTLRQIAWIAALLICTVLGMSAMTAQASAVLDELQFDEYSFPAILVDGEPYALTVEAFSEYTCQWESETPDIATVDENGQVTPVSIGTAFILAHVWDEEEQEYTFRIPIHVVNPHLDVATMNLASGCEAALQVQDSSGEAVVFTTTNKQIVNYVYDDAGQVVVKAGKTLGTATIALTVDGVTMTCDITVTNPKLKGEYQFYQKNKKFQVVVTGTNKASQFVWTSSNAGVASVTKAGRVKTKKLGSTVISCEVDGKTLNCYVAVAKEKVVKALRWGYKKVGKYHYSQARRMNKNYFDCSSFVYRCYRAAGKYLVSKASWAPVAADIGRYYVQKKCQIKPTGSSYSESKLRPGDLICFGGKTAQKNGRYKRIYHIAIYIGNGKTLESSSSSNNVVIKERGIIKKKEAPVVVRPV
jgi:cell wall-associated NlpC family hydrolase